jgi:hypothetical protein
VSDTIDHKERGHDPTCERSSYSRRP